MSTNWGGKRENAGSGGKREGAGRPRTRWNSGGPGAAWVCEKQTIGKWPEKPEMWRVLSVGQDEIEFQCGDTIIVLRKPDD